MLRPLFVSVEGYQQRLEEIRMARDRVSPGLEVMRMARGLGPDLEMMEDVNSEERNSFLRVSSDAASTISGQTLVDGNNGK